MTARARTLFGLSYIAVAVAIALGLLAIRDAAEARAEAPVIALTAPHTGSASAVPAMASPAQRPSDEIANPVDDPIGAINDAREAQRQNWALFGLAIAIMVSRGLGTLRSRYPASKLLARMTGRPGLIVAGVGFVGASAFDALALGGSWYAVVVAAIGALLSLLVPEPSTAAKAP